MANWNHSKVETLRKDHGLKIKKIPELDQLRFVQIDEFYPIDPDQHKHSRIRATNGLVFLKELTIDQFLGQARSLASSIEGNLYLNN